MWPWLLQRWVLRAVGAKTSARNAWFDSGWGIMELLDISNLFQFQEPYRLSAKLTWRLTEFVYERVTSFTHFVISILGRCGAFQFAFGPANDRASVTRKRNSPISGWTVLKNSLFSLISLLLCSVYECSGKCTHSTEAHHTEGRGRSAILALKFRIP